MTSPLAFDPVARAHLAERARQACIVFPDHPMPSGVSPTRARIGVESHADGTTLLVDRGLDYSGPHLGVRTWILSGRREFADLPTTLEWLSRALTDVLPDDPSPVVPDPATTDRSRQPSGQRSEAEAPLPAPAVVTDLDAVHGEPDPAPITIDDLQQALADSIFGQDGAIRAVAELVALHLGKVQPRRPASVMLLGPTGSGKTETARQLAAAVSRLSEDDWGHLRLDMAEFAEAHSVARLIGAPPGYLGYGDRNLAAVLAENPRQIVLFDEIEKAHPSVLTALMNLIDVGRLDSARHGSISAASAVLLFTSNLGVQSLPDHEGSTAEVDHRGRAHLLEHGMRREIVGRFSRVCLYGPVTGAAAAAAAVRAVQRVGQDYNCRVDHIDPEYLTELLRRSHRQGLGVRGVEHLVDLDLGLALSRLADQAVQVRADRSVEVIDIPVPDEPVAQIHSLRKPD